MKQTWQMLVISLYSVMGIWGFTIVLTLIYIEIFQNKTLKKILANLKGKQWHRTLLQTGIVFT